MDKANKIKHNKFNLYEVVGITIITAIVGFTMGLFVKKESSKETSLSNYENELISNYRYILNQYYKNIEGRDLVAVAIKGMIDSLDDPYANYITSEDTDTFDLIINGEYHGIGIQVGYTDENELTIFYVFKNSPADLAELKPGDIIISIDDKNITDKSLDEIKEMIASYANKEFDIKYKRDNEEFTTTIKNDKVVVQSAFSEMYEENDKKIGYLQLTNFASNSYEQFHEELIKLEKDNIDSLIIDLRDNSGGQLATVENILSLFIKKGECIYQMKTQNKITKTYDKTDEKREYKIVVLVNENSASASELMTGTLKEIYGATIIGQNTYGKGTAQKLVELDNGEKYKFTTNEWLTANGNSIEKVGVEPNIKIGQSEEYYDNPILENDNQLKEAIKILSE